MFERLRRGGTPMTGTTYKDTLVRLPDGGIVGLRTTMERSPSAAAAINVNIKGIPIEKLKFNS